MERQDWDNATRRLLADLQVDRVLALSQVRRRYVLASEQEEVCRWLQACTRRGTVTVREVSVPPTARARLTQRIAIVGPPGASVRHEEIAHHLGLAEMRWHLREKLWKWKTATQSWSDNRKLRERPDAVAEDGTGLVVVEYDHGAYSAADIVRKQRAFAAFAPRQVWGTSAEHRRRWLLKHIPDTNILVVKW